MRHKTHTRITNASSLIQEKTNVKPRLNPRRTPARKKGKHPGKYGNIRPGRSIAIARGLHLKVNARGSKRWLLSFQHKRKHYRKVIGDAAVMPRAEAEAIARAAISQVRSGRGGHPVLPAQKRFETAGTFLLKAYSRHLKPVTRAGSERCFRDYLLPRFRDCPIDAISREDVLNWFDSMRDKPGAANRSLPLLSVLMQQAELYGLREEGSNPCTRIRRYRLKARECFLVPEEIRRLGRTLLEEEARRPGETALIRLLVLTGCRKSELLTLRWSSYREGHLYLPDSKTGPKTIFLSTPARQILDALPRRG